MFNTLIISRVFYKLKPDVFVMFVFLGEIRAINDFLEQKNRQLKNRRFKFLRFASVLQEKLPKNSKNISSNLTDLFSLFIEIEL